MDKCIEYECRIDFFSCWNPVIHDSVITTECHRRNVTLQLSRETDDGTISADIVCVRVTFEDRLDDLGPHIMPSELSLLRADRSSFWTSRLSSVYTFYEKFEFNFEEIVAEIRHNQPFFDDRLILRLRVKDRERNEHIGMHFAFDVRTLCLEIALPSLMTDLLPYGHGQCLATFEWPTDSEEGIRRTDVLNVKIYKCPNQKIELKLDSVLSRDMTFLRSQLSVFDRGGFEIRAEENEVMLQQQMLWTLSNSLTRDEIEQEGIRVILSLKMVASEKLISLYNQTSTFRNSVSEVLTSSHHHTVLSQDLRYENNDCSNILLISDDNVLAILPPHHPTVVSQDLRRENNDFSDDQPMSGDVSIPNTQEPSERPITCLRDNVFRRRQRLDERRCGRRRHRCNNNGPIPGLPQNRHNGRYGRR